MISSEPTSDMSVTTEPWTVVQDNVTAQPTQDQTLSTTNQQTDTTTSGDTTTQSVATTNSGSCVCGPDVTQGVSQCISNIAKLYV